ncbi:MAG TPA: pilus assembly protein TadG-related protein [Dongiaceae bacterium]|jgi:Flp pilus assembly protein TadG|nr:pilus assembly protein TadG-related protein [Dongiaceae bacterium]
MKKLGIIGKNLRKLRSCERGAVAPLVGICAIMLVGAVAVAVDVGRGQVAQSKLQAALDAAGLAAGAVVSKNVTDAQLKTEAWKYLNENFAGYTVDATIAPDDFDLVRSDDEMVVTLEARASLPTTFMRIFGHDIMNVAARTEITREMTGLEVALVLDVTGSMCDPCTKRDAMKQGAHDLMNIMFGSNATVDDLWIGIVPFSQSVNIGTSRTGWLSNYAFYNDKIYCSGSKTSGTVKCPNDSLTIDSAKVSTTTNPLTRVNRYMDSNKSTWYFRPHGWAGCVEAREANGRDVTDDPPSVEGFPVYFAPDTSYPGSNNTGTNNWRGPTDSSGTSNGAYRVNSSRSANKSCPQNAITPLTNVKATLDAAITALQVGGYTQLPMGASWGWRLLSPKWQGVWGGDMDTNDLPLDYDAPLSHKIVIFMTDGNNDMPGEASDSDSSNRDPDNYTAYGKIGDGRIDGIVEDGAAELEMDNRFAEICTAMKGDEQNPTGITIYTISFGTDVKESSKALLKSCASLNDYYFDAPTEAALQDVFHEIGDALSKLRVSR